MKERRERETNHYNILFRWEKIGRRKRNETKSKVNPELFLSPSGGFGVFFSTGMQSLYSGLISFTVEGYGYDGTVCISWTYAQYNELYMD